MVKAVLIIHAGASVHRFSWWPPFRPNASVAPQNSAGPLVKRAAEILVIAAAASAVVPIPRRAPRRPAGVAPASGAAGWRAAAGATSPTVRQPMMPTSSESGSTGSV